MSGGQNYPMQQPGYGNPPGSYPDAYQEGPGYQGYPPGGGYPAQPPPPANYNYPPPAQGRAPGPATVSANRNPNPSRSRARDNHTVEEAGFAGSSFSEKAIRRAFIKKVYLILMTQLLVTAGFICFFLFYEPANSWVKANRWFYFTSYGVFLVLYIVLICCPSVRRKFPANYICLALFTLAFSYVAGTASSYHSVTAVLIAIGLTTGVCLAISIFATQTKIDFTMCHGLIFAACIVLLLSGLLFIILWRTIPSGHTYLQAVYGTIAALIFALFLVYDTQMIVGGRRYELSPEEYIYGALSLYMDIVFMFLIMLGCSGGAGN